MAAPSLDTEREQSVPRGGGRLPDEALARRASDCRAGLPAAEIARANAARADPMSTTSGP